MNPFRGEKAWLACEEPEKLIDYLGFKRLDARRWRLFAAACYRQVWGELPPVCRQAVETAERFADGAATRDEVDAAQAAVIAAARATDVWWPHLGCGLLCSWGGSAAKAMVPHATRDLQNRQPTREATETQIGVQCDMLRDLYDFSAIPFDPTWRTETAVGLAGAIYCGFRFADMPVLADALEEAGCDSPRMLAHCRHAAPHTRGCWALDAVLRGPPADGRMEPRA